MSDEPFWDLWDYDDEDNTIYYHPGWWGEEECGPYKYLLRTMLHGDKICYHLTHEQFKEIDEYYDSLGAAEKACLEEIENEKHMDNWMEEL